MKTLFLMAAFLVFSLNVKAETFESGHDWAHGNFWSITGTNPSPKNCTYVGYSDGSAQCAGYAYGQGYSDFKTSNAKYSYKSFSHGQFGSEQVIACFGCN